VHWQYRAKSDLCAGEYLGPGGNWDVYHAGPKEDDYKAFGDIEVPGIYESPASSVDLLLSPPLLLAVPDQFPQSSWLEILQIHHKGFSIQKETKSKPQ
jgi:hypothetical protein